MIIASELGLHAKLKHGFFSRQGGVSSGVYEGLNCGYGSGRSVLDVVKSFKKISKKNLIIRFKPRRTADLEQIIADVSKLKKILKWKPKFNNLSLMVKSCINWEKSIKSIYVKN